MRGAIVAQSRRANIRGCAIFGRGCTCRTDDPIFQDLAISLIFGILVSTMLTLVAIPVLYYRFHARAGGQRGRIEYVVGCQMVEKTGRIGREPCRRGARMPVGCLRGRCGRG